MRVKAKKTSDTEFAIDISLVTNTVKEAKELMREVEAVSARVGLKMNEQKTKYMYLVENIHEPEGITSMGAQKVELVNDFLYLGAKIRNSEDIATRKKKAWIACHSLKAVWKSDLQKDLKIRLFTATFESVLLYGSETWTMTKCLTKIVDSCYTRMLRMALNINQYMMRITNTELYGNLPKVSSKVAQRRLRLGGHAQRHPELTLHSDLLWEPLHGRAGRGRPRQTYIKGTLRADTELQDTRDIANIMEHRERWRDIVHGSQEHYPT